MSAVAPDLPGARVLDLFAGSGALGLEALSRGAEHATFVERSASALRVLHRNVEALGAGPRSHVVRADVLRYVETLDAGAFDVALADPPYGTGLAAGLVERYVAVPFAALLCLEHGPSDRLPDLPGAVTRRYGETRLTFLRRPE
jgi:16S rRNA (guanine966-N2)-methyltransferase